MEKKSMANRGRKSVADKFIGLVEHMRYCVECRQTDVLRCSVGRKLWFGAGMEGEALGTFADGKRGCAKCGRYADTETFIVLHAEECNANR
jgi:hypothetical protein